jgi:nitrogenase molybdenum-cofactor synthesis protein NifE
VGEWLNADPFELSLSLIRNGFAVSEIFGTVGGSNFVYVKKIAALSPETKIYSNLSPSMMFYDGKDAACDTVIGRDAMYYHPALPGVPWNDELQPFGYAGVAALFGELAHALSAKEDAR